MATVIRGDDNFDSAVNGRVVQMVNFQTGVAATGTSIIPMDDTIPQITEGTEYMTLNITPKHASNRLVINVSIFATSDTNNYMTTALFVGTTANALSANSTVQGANNWPLNSTINHEMVSGSTSTLTFRVRFGGQATETSTFNGVGGARKFGTMPKSSITITEYEP